MDPPTAFLVHAYITYLRCWSLATQPDCLFHHLDYYWRDISGICGADLTRVTAGVALFWAERFLNNNRLHNRGSYKIPLFLEAHVCFLRLAYLVITQVYT